jgi:hypothetical protein
MLGHLLNSVNASANVLEIPASAPAVVLAAAGRAISANGMIATGEAEVRILGEANTAVRVMVALGTFYSDDSVPASDDPFAVNSIDAAQTFDLVLDANGSATLPITLDQAGTYTVFAVTVGENGATSDLSNRVRVIVG